MKHRAKNLKRKRSITEIGHLTCLQVLSLMGKYSRTGESHPLLQLLLSAIVPIKLKCIQKMNNFFSTQHIMELCYVGTFST